MNDGSYVYTRRQREWSTATAWSAANSCTPTRTSSTRSTRRCPEEEILYDLAELFKIFGDSTRIKILYVLLEAEMCVCDIAQLLNMNQSAISHQLRVLKQSQLVKFRREGKTVFYSLADRARAHHPQPGHGAPGGVNAEKGDTL